MKKLRWTQRLAIQSGIQEGKSNAQIAREIGVHRATVGREIARNAQDREHYRAYDADIASWDRQKEAMPKRFLVTFNGVELLSTLNKRNKLYTYFSRTHLNALSRYASGIPLPWDSSYVRINEKMRFMPDPSYLRVKSYEFRINWEGSNLFGYGSSDHRNSSRLPISSPSKIHLSTSLPLHSAHPLSNELKQVQSLSSARSDDFNRHALLPHNSGAPDNGSTASASSFRAGDHSYYLIASHFSRPVVLMQKSPAAASCIFIPKAACFPIKNSSPHCFSICPEKLPSVA